MQKVLNGVVLGSTNLQLQDIGMIHGNVTPVARWAGRCMHMSIISKCSNEANCMGDKSMHTILMTEDMAKCACLERQH